MAEKRFYIRFGGIPRDEQSVAWTTENEIKGKEPAVSVYDALYLDEPDGGWKLFCKRHPQYRPEGFRDLMMEQCGDILSKPVLEYLHWN
ncbi:MAG: hypothetical protein K6A73_02090 [Bacteroidales bacterium]|nr:hypothetical protein [Bacteroidales bacterium]